MSTQYARPEALVSTEWVAQHLDDPNVRLIESNEDVLLYNIGHIRNAVKVDWVVDLNDPIVRDYIGPKEFEALCSKHGITNDTFVVFYGDKNNWWATYAFWVFQLFGHTRAAVMNGGRKRWIEDGRELVKDVPMFAPTVYHAPQRQDYKIRALFTQVLAHQSAGLPLIDVRSPKEYSGELLHMPEYPQEGTLRGGHIKGARSVPWARAANEDGTFKSVGDLKAIYESEAGLDADKNVVVYCRIGERSSHTWFVLTYLLGYPNVRNYDGSWTEWGNVVGAPIEK